MNPPDEDRKSESELDYAPPWIRQQAAREQGSREQAPHEQPPREPAPPELPARDQPARDQFRATLRRSGGMAAEQAAQNEAEGRSFGDDRPWHQRALEPELVPAPPAGVLNIWPMLLRMFAVCAIAAMVAAAVVFLFSPRQTAPKVAQATAYSPANTADDAPAPSEPSRAAAAGLPALAVDTSAGVTTPPQQGQVAMATPQQQGETASPPPEAQVVTTPPVKPEAPAQQIANLPPPNSSPANINTSPAPVANEPVPPPAETNPAATEPKPAASPTPSAPAQAAPQPPPQAAVVLDENEINTLIRRGKNLLNDGDFAAARVPFERAANAGSAEAALALGSTYDPSVIKRLGAIMVKPDIESARKWYQLAAERGSAAATLQLANLPQPR